MATFMAVQCFSCSTMQVKQQKKSSNKWTCAVCNEKQSARKVYATSLMAKDVRKFVQSFNMSRKSADDGYDDLQARNLTVAAEDAPAPVSSKRGSTATDWTAYLDAPEPHEIQEEAESAAVEMFKKPRLGPIDDLKGKGLHKPIFSKRNAPASSAANKSSSQGMPKSDGDSLLRQGKCGCTAVGRTPDSKWSAYVTDDAEELETVEACFSSDSTGGAFGVTADGDDLRFEEDIHPDFE
uniref:MRN complex-interacting protein N-terminal domain-containing protein n=1 Tax=Kalanchoe fedtschenkoi TaxID=63787 RepID=A0A7N0T1W7_KALFE